MLSTSLGRHWAEAKSEAAGLTDAPAEADYFNWHKWAFPKQLPPPGDWTTWLLMGGRGSGKTRAGAEWVRSLARQGVSPIALVGETMAEIAFDVPHRVRNERVGGEVDARESTIARIDDMLLEHLAVAHTEPCHRQRVEYFVRKQHPQPVQLGRTIDPVRARSE